MVKQDIILEKAQQYAEVFADVKLPNERDVDTWKYVIENAYIKGSEVTEEMVNARLGPYDKVNQCETFEELALVIEDLADENGMIQGRVKSFKAEKMAEAARTYREHLYPNYLTREFGIRQQGMYIDHYTK